MTDNTAAESHWFRSRPPGSQRVIRVAFMALVAVLFAWSRYLFSSPVGNGIEADFSLLVSGLVTAIALLVGVGHALYIAAIKRQWREALVSLVWATLPMLELILILQYLTRVRGIALI